MQLVVTCLEMEGDFPDLDDEDDDFILSQVNLQPPSTDNFNENNLSKPDTSKNPLGKRTSTSPLNSDLNNRFCDNPKRIILDTSNDRNRSRSSFTKTPKKLSKRRFPGPAGLLPTLKSSELDLLDKSRLVFPNVDKVADSHKLPDGSVLPKSPCSRAIAANSQDDSPKTLLEKQTRSELLTHLQLKINSSRILTTLNISWIHNNIMWLPKTTRIPFLLLTLLDAPELGGGGSRGSKPPCVRCTDETGSIEAAINYNFAVEHINDLSPGTCLALQNVSLVRVGKEVTLMIIPRSLICMTSIREGDLQKAQDWSQRSSDRVKFTTFCEFVPDEIWRNYENLLAIKTRIEHEAETQQQQRQQSVQKISERNTTVLETSRRTSGYFPPGQNNNEPVQCEQVEDIEDDPFFEDLEVNFDEIDRVSMAM